MTATGIHKEGARPRRSYQRLSERLRRFMAEERFQSGDRLPPERTLAENFEVSRSSIRKAIQMLADKGLLESRQGDGTYVRAPDMEPLKNAILEAVDSENLVFDEIMEFRKILEPAIAELAALRHSPEQLDQLKIIACDQQRRLLAGQEDGDLDARFHHCLALCAGNSLLAGTMDHLNKRYATGRTAELRDAQWRQFSVSSHLRIIDALERRSPADCRKAIEEHLNTILQTHPFVITRD